MFTVLLADFTPHRYVTDVFMKYYLGNVRYTQATFTSIFNSRVAIRFVEFYLARRENTLNVEAEIFLSIFVFLFLFLLLSLLAKVTKNIIKRNK